MNANKELRPVTNDPRSELTKMLEKNKLKNKDETAFTAMNDAATRKKNLYLFRTKGTTQLKSGA
jgi:hypothetical protein